MLGSPEMRGEVIGGEEMGSEELASKKTRSV